MNVQIEDFNDMTWFTTPNNWRENSMRYLADQVVFGAENALRVIQIHVESLSDEDAVECFEVLRFNYEFLAHDAVMAAATRLKAAESPLEVADQVKASDEATLKNALAEWNFRIKALQELWMAVERALSPSTPRIGLSSIFLRRLSIHDLKPDRYLETPSFVHDQIAEFRDKVNEHAMNTGDILPTRIVRKMRQLVLELDARANEYKKIEGALTKSSAQFEQLSNTFQIAQEDLIRELTPIGKAGEIALLRLYTKLRAAEEASQKQSKASVG